MKTLFLLSILFATFTHVARAEEPLLCGGHGPGGSGDGHHGWSMGPVMKLTTFNGDFAVLAGGQVGMIVDHAFMIGGAMYGMVTEHQPTGVPAGYPVTADRTRSEMSYGGMMLSYIGLSTQALHPTFDLLIGGGRLEGYSNIDDWNDRDGNDSDHMSGDGFFVLEPTVNAEFTLARSVRAGVGAGYRLVSGISTWGFTNSDVGGPSASVVLKFGMF